MRFAQFLCDYSHKTILDIIKYHKLIFRNFKAITILEIKSFDSP